MIESRLFGIIFKQEESDWPDENIKKIIEEFKNFIGNDTYIELAHNNDMLRETLAMETEMWYGKEINIITRDVSELTLNLAEDILQEKSSNLLSQIAQVEQENNKDKSKEFLKQYQETITNIHNIKNRRQG